MLELTASNQEIEKAAGDLIDKTGKTNGSYYDSLTGCYCALGAIRMAIFGTTDIHLNPQSDSRMSRYYDVIDGLAVRLGWDKSSQYDPHGAVGHWNDNNDKGTVVKTLRREV